LPGPVDFHAGLLVAPPLMPGWNEFPVAEHLRQEFGVPVLVDNDVNVMAVGEHRKIWPEVAHLLFLKVGTGIGSGMILSGKVHRGADGAAGDIGHTHLAGYDKVTCRCGNPGCLEAVAGGAALAESLRAMGISASSSRDVVDLARNGRIEALQVIRQAGRLIGEALASAVNLLNPAIIVIGGDIASLSEPLLAGVRESLYRRSLPLATRDLQIVPSQLGDRAGVAGCAVMVGQSVLFSQSSRDRQSPLLEPRQVSRR
jgi:predicted NBD/HSP70 family sugar kinase